MRATGPVMAKIDVEGRIVCATFEPSSGRLQISEDSKLLQVLSPPDSWVAIATASQSSGWGTRPSEADLMVFLEGYVSRDSRLSLS